MRQYQYLAAWERMNNQNFNSIEFEGIKAISGENKFSISVKQWVSRTNAIGIYANAGRYGGTCAHPDLMDRYRWVTIGQWLKDEIVKRAVNNFAIKNNQS
jgi:hypothetical protein